MLPSETYTSPKVYDQLKEYHALKVDYLIKNEKFDFYRKAAVVRHPFSRLFSSWNDKFRTGEFHYELKNKSAFSWEQTKIRKEKYLDVFSPTISVFENPDVTPPNLRNVTFQAFLKYVSVQGSASRK